MNNPDFFPDLRLATLEKYASSWAVFFESLGVFAESITLHFPLQQYFRGKKYLVLFRIKEIADPAKDDRYVPIAIKRVRGPEAKWTQWDVLSRASSFLREQFLQPTLFHGFEEVYDTPPPEGSLKRDWVFRFSALPTLRQDYPSAVVYNEPPFEGLFNLDWAFRFSEIPMSGQVYNEPPFEGLFNLDWGSRFNTNPMLGQDYPWVADIDEEHAWSLWPPLVAKSENKQEKQRRASSYDRDKARDIARRKWEGDETLTPHDIAQQIINLPTNPFRREYTEKTITDWIHDLRPGFAAGKKGRIAKSK